MALTTTVAVLTVNSAATDAAMTKIFLSAVDLGLAGGGTGTPADRAACGTAMAWWHEGQLICDPE